MANSLASMLAFHALKDSTPIEIPNEEGLTPRALRRLIDAPGVECVLMHPGDYSHIAMSPDSFGVELCYTPQENHEGMMCRLDGVTIMQTSQVLHGMMRGPSSTTRRCPRRSSRSTRPAFKR